MAKGGSPMGGGGFGGQQQGGFGGQQQGGYGGGGGFGGMLGQSSGGFQPSRQNFNQMPQQQNFGGFDGGYGMPQQQQNFGGFGGGYNMSQQYTDDGSGYGGGYGMPQQLQQFQQQARQYQQPMQRFQQQRQYQQPMQQRQYQQPMQQRQTDRVSTDMVSNAAMPQGYNMPMVSMPQQGDGSSQAGAQSAYQDFLQDAGGNSRNLQPLGALTNMRPPVMPQQSSGGYGPGVANYGGGAPQQSQQALQSQMAQQSQMPPALNMNQTFPEDQRMQFMRMMQQTNFSGGRPYGRSEYTQRY